MKAFIVNNYWYPQTRFFDGKFLYAIGFLCRFRWMEPSDNWIHQLADPIFGKDVFLLHVLMLAVQLRDLFRKGHSIQELLDPLFNRQSGIQIR